MELLTRSQKIKRMHEIIDILSPEQIDICYILIRNADKY